MHLRIYLTGRVGVAVGSELVLRERQFRDRQGRRLFAYLVTSRGRPVPRAELAQITWPDEMPVAWEAALSALVSRLRRALDVTPLRELGVALSGGFGQYQLHLPADAWVDLEATTAALDEAEAALRAGDPGHAFGFAGVVYAIGNRPFLAGDEGAWVATQRTALERQFLRALDCLARVWLTTAEPIHAVEMASQALAIDPYRESSYQLLMRAHAACGRTPEAIRAYHRLRDLLDRELGTDPSAETEALFLDLIR
jgi:DNA-binding SARP family transcriptional activator